MGKTILKISNLQVASGQKEILKGINLSVGLGQIHVVMGPNGSGKSTLAQVIAGSPFYKVIGGKLTVQGKEISKLTPDKRAKMGIFLGFQSPVEVPGVSVFNVLRKASNGKGLTLSKGVSKAKRSNLNSGVSQFRQQLLEYASSLKLSDDHLGRSFNEGFSGGEKKRNEILQMLALKPKLVILDEIDSGLDVDGLRIVAGAVADYHVKNPKSSIILITHYARILKYLKADFVHVMTSGKIVKSGNQKLARDIEEKGYEFLKKSTVDGLQSTEL